MRSSGLVIRRASGGTCQRAATITASASRTPRFPKVVDLTHVSNEKLTRRLCGLAHLQNTAKASDYTRVKGERSTSTFASRTFTEASLTALRSTFVRRHTTSTMASSTPDTTQQWTAVKVRDTFLKYFEERGHTIGENRPSPTLLTTTNR
jgi:hypothetical protein